MLANATIVNINEKQHKDLVVAMRGGGSQFGIVTKFTVKTYPVSKVSMYDYPPHPYHAKQCTRSGLARGTTM